MKQKKSALRMRYPFKRWRFNAAYTLLELMLALALLGALMTVAWTLMGTFRDAELRGWKLAQRTQTIRAARLWLENDVQHLLRQETSLVGVATSQVRLSGNAQGFTASIAPSIDPLPFYELALATPQTNSQPMANEVPTASLVSDLEAVVTQAQRSLWPADTLQIEYRLIPSVDQLTVTQSMPLQASNPTDLQFSLTRRELLDASTVEDNGNGNSTLNPSQLAGVSDRVLTAEDLYRQTDETREPVGVSLRETRLDGLTNSQFQYFDGVSWKLEWNSSQVGRLPHAIALVFDFPPRADMQPGAVRPAPAGVDNHIGPVDAGDPATSESLNAGLSFSEAALASEPLAESSASENSDLMQNAAHQVQIIVYLNGHSLAHVSQWPFEVREEGELE